MIALRIVIWKLRYALELCRVLRISWTVGWQSAEAAFEELYDLEDDPIRAAHDEVEEWRASI
jgi:hypothetical protein